MKTSYNEKPPILSYSQHWNWLLIWGILLIILGIVAIGASAATTVISIIFLGALIFASGIIVLIDAFKSWWGQFTEFLINFIMAILYLWVGLTLMANPVLSSVTLTLLLGIFYIVVGVVRLFYALVWRRRKFGYSIFSGLIALLLGILILANWPQGSLFIIGLFIGIDILVIGITYVMISLSAKALTSK